MYKNIINVLKITKDLMEKNVKVGDRVLDCTLGKGNDSLNLARLVGDKGKVYGFDIQDFAIEKTREKLAKENLLGQVEIIKDSHENIDKYIVEPLDFIIYNLGYLPGGNKEIITRGETSLTSIIKGLELLKENGLMVIVTYIGHKGGLEEFNLINDYLKKLNQKEYNVLKYEFVNQINKPPKVFVVEKSYNESR